MKQSKKKITKPKRTLRILKKRRMRISTVGRKKKEKPPARKETRNAERLRFQGLVAGLSKTRDSLGKKVRKQSDELKIRKGQLRRGVVQEKRAQEEIQILTKAIESTPDGIFIIDAQQSDFSIIYINSAFHQMTGYEMKEILGRSYFSFMEAKSNPRIDEIKQALDQDKYFLGETLNVRKNGEQYWNLLRLTPVRDADGSVTHYVGIKTDMTLMRQRDLEIQEQREEILHVTRVGRVAELVSSLAHEISQPLTAILSYAQAAQRMFADREPALQEILQYIVNDDQRAAEVIQRLRSLLKKGKPVFQPLDINALILDTVKLLKTDVTVRNKVLRTELDSGLPLILGDRIQLQQVLLNLISNGLEAMEASENDRELLIRTLREASGKIKVAVRDSGCGIPAPNMSKLFTHFFTTKLDGLGMGLSISRSIVEVHGGRLEAENNPDRGAAFYFTLPTVPSVKGNL